MRSIVLTQYCRVALGDAALRYELLPITPKSIVKINNRFPIIQDWYCITNIVNFAEYLHFKEMYNTHIFMRFALFFLNL